MDYINQRYMLVCTSDAYFKPIDGKLNIVQDVSFNIPGTNGMVWNIEWQIKDAGIGYPVGTVINIGSHPITKSFMQKRIES